MPPKKRTTVNSVSRLGLHEHKLRTTFPLTIKISFSRIFNQKSFEHGENLQIT